MRGCDECSHRKGCPSRKLLRAVERECGLSVGVDGCDYRDHQTVTSWIPGSAFHAPRFVTYTVHAKEGVAK